MASPLRLRVVDIDLFESIVLDKVYIKIGRKRIKITQSGIFNQVVAYFKITKQDTLFLQWFYDKFELDTDEVVPFEVIQAWEKKLVLDTRGMIYSEGLRIMHTDGVIKVYGVESSGCVLQYLADTDNIQFYKKIINYLKYNRRLKIICQERGIEHALRKSNALIKSEIDMCLEDDLIPEVGKIAPISNNTASYCFGYYDLSMGNPNAATPAWDSFMYQIPDDGSKECFKAWVYSVFKDDNFGRQALWIHGQGNSGKSVITRAISLRLSKLNPKLCAALPSKFMADKFTTSAFENKRFVFMPDATERDLIRRQLVKNITGNDDVTGRSMHAEERLVNIYAKLMITSNCIPWVNVELPEELSRILYITLDGEACRDARDAWDIKTQGDWRQQIDIEIDDFVAKCRGDYYANLQEDGHNIKTYANMSDNIEEGEYSVRRDMKIWWNECIVPYDGESKGNVMTVTDLCDDYTRFIAPLNTNGRMDRRIRRFMLTTLRGLVKTPIYDLGIGNILYVDGFMFKDKTPDNRVSLKSMAQEMKKQINNNSVEKVERYGKF